MKGNGYYEKNHRNEKFEKDCRSTYGSGADDVGSFGAGCV